MAGQVLDALGLAVNWYSGSWEGAAALGPFVSACMAVATGMARHVLIYRTTTEATAQGAGPHAGQGMDRASIGISGPFQYLIPMGAMSAACWVAPYAEYHRRVFGLSREILGQIAINQRKNAALNPAAILRKPMCLDDYLAARMIASPLCLFDCDLPCDGSVALVVSHVETAADARHVPIQVHALGTASHGRPSWDQWPDLATFPGRDPARQLWERADVGPADVDLAQLYDGFSILVALWLEALGFCGTGEAGAFIDGGRTIARDGALPVNTCGGQLSAGRLHGYGLIHEAVTQMRGDAGERQLGEQPEVSVLSFGAGMTVGCMLLTRGLE
jgi:acetyl-CoA acetyltransferase